jgi:hypothetical protein
LPFFWCIFLMIKAVFYCDYFVLGDFFKPPDIQF